MRGLSGSMPSGLMRKSVVRPASRIVSFCVSTWSRSSFMSLSRRRMLTDGMGTPSRSRRGSQAHGVVRVGQDLAVAGEAEHRIQVRRQHRAADEALKVEATRVAQLAGASQLLETGYVDAAVVVGRRGAIEQLATLEARYGAEAQRQHLVHEIAADQVRRIAQAVRVLLAAGVQQQADALDGGGTHHHDIGAGLVPRAGGLVDVGDTRGLAAFASVLTCSTGEFDRSVRLPVAAAAASGAVVRLRWASTGVAPCERSARPSLSRWSTRLRRQA